MKYTTQEKRARRHVRIRAKVSGTAERPRLAVFKSNKYIYAQLINDDAHTTLAAANDLAAKGGTKTDHAIAVGTDIAKQAQKLGITSVVFDRAGFRFTGRMKAVADAAREAGLAF